VTWEFLNALEESGSAHRRTGLPSLRANVSVAVAACLPKCLCCRLRTCICCLCVSMAMRVCVYGLYTGVYGHACVRLWPC